MKWKKTMTKRIVSVEFGGLPEEVDVNTFAKVLLDYSRLIKISAKSIDENVVIDTRITATRPGCLTADLSIVAQNIGDLFKDVEPYFAVLSSAVTIVGGLYKLKQYVAQHGNFSRLTKHEDGTSTLEFPDGTTRREENVTVKLYCNREASKTVNDTFVTLDADKNIQSIRITDEDQTELTYVEQREFAAIANTPLPADEEEKIQDIRQETTVRVVKPVFVKSSKYKWELLWNGVQISANITDKNFLENRLAKESFKMGTVMNVVLELHQKWSEASYGFVNQSYRIVEVHEVILPNNETQQLF